MLFVEIPFIMSFVDTEVRMGTTVSVFDSSASLVGVSRCEIESSYIY